MLSGTKESINKPEKIYFQKAKTIKFQLWQQKQNLCQNTFLNANSSYCILNEDDLSSAKFYSKNAAEVQKPLPRTPYSRSKTGQNVAT